VAIASRKKSFAVEEASHDSVAAIKHALIQSFGISWV